MTPFAHLPGDILTGLQRARSFAAQCDGPVSTLIAAPQFRGLPVYTVGRTFWSASFEEACSFRPSSLA